MPRYSIKYHTKNDTYRMFVREYVEQGDLTEDVLTWLMIYQSLHEQRYLYDRLPIPKSNWAHIVLPQLSDDRFRKILRMDRLSFKYVTSLIKDDPVFYNNSNIPQTPVHAQLHYALYKFGSDGKAGSWTSGASKWGISEGHMYDCTLRVIEALCKLKDQLIIWPNQNKRKMESMKNSDREGFLGAVGELDGTDIVLKFKPGGAFRGEIFFNRKKRYALDLCAVCDSSKRLHISLQVGQIRNKMLEFLLLLLSIAIRDDIFRQENTS